MESNRSPFESRANGRRNSLGLDSPESTKILFLIGTFFGMGLMLLIMQFFRSGEDEDIAHYRQVRDLVVNTFVGDVSEQELLEDALRGMLNGLDDYSDYYVSEETVAIDRETTGRAIGIGVIMRYRGGPRVLFPIANSPAIQAGLRVGDEFLSLDGTPTEDLSSDELNDLMRGDPGTAVKIRVRGLDQSIREVEVVRREMPVPSVRRVSLIDRERNIGYIALTSFSNRSTEEFDEAVSQLQAEGMQALVLDLRGNQGGVLSSAVEISQRFVREGILTSTRGRGMPHIEEADPDLAWYFELPLVLLVDGNSASASEVLAGALQDHRAAVLLGEPTYGKGVVQTISRYPERRAIAKLTTSYYYTPANRNLERSVDGHDYGLLPDFEISLPRKQQQGIYEYLHGSFEPPREVIPALRDWELSSGESLILDAPEDSQLEAALGIFAGKLPG